MNSTNNSKEEKFSSIYRLLNQLWGHFPKKRKFQTYLLILLVFISAILEVVSLGAVIPFIGVITAPELVLEYNSLRSFLEFFDITTPDQIIKPITILFCTAALMAGLVRALLLWISTKLAYSTGADLSIEVYKKTLFQPYKVHLERNTSVVISGIISKIHGVISRVLFPLLAMVNSFFLLIAITSTLIFINPQIALTAIFGFGISYLMMTIVSRKTLLSNASKEAEGQNQVIKSLQEGLGGIRDVLLSGSQSLYSQAYSLHERPLRKAQGNSVFIGQSPRFAMEAFGMILIALIAYGLSSSLQGSSTSSETMQMLGVLAFAAQRLLPALQQIYNGISSLVGHKISLNDVVELLDQPIDINLAQPTDNTFTFEDEIELRDLSFQYNSDSDCVVSNVNLIIPKGKKIGFVGTTGSGKSTTLDLIMGLLQPSEGKILVDGLELGPKNISSWQKNISHVSQNIFLSDDSYTSNIAFGVPEDQVDMGLVKRAARLAKIDDFIESTHLGYDSTVGERGIGLSGGQKQRIGIARALYKQAPFIVFDEATSSLDNTTEKEVMKSIAGLEENLTILLIAHRLTTIQDCHTIIEMSEGKVVAQGTYDELLLTSNSFKLLAQDLAD